MAGKPYQSCLIPHENEILSLRQRRPPMPYAQIAGLLFGKYQIRVCHETIFKSTRCSLRNSRARASSWADCSRRHVLRFKPNGGVLDSSFHAEWQYG